MAFSLNFEVTNDAFQNDLHGEMERIMRKVLEAVETGRESGKVLDVNGNTVGEWSMS